MRFLKVKLLFWVALLAIMGCAPAPEEHIYRVHRGQVKAGMDSAYAQGYADGCSSAWYLEGFREYPFRKNAVRTQHDAQYARGWREGHRVCLAEAKQEASKNRHGSRRFFLRNSSSSEDYEGPGPARYKREEIRPDDEDIYRSEQEAIWEELRK